MKAERGMIMSVGMRIFWLVTMFIFLGGCGGYRQTSLSKDGSGNEFGLVEEIKPGDRVRLFLTDGKVVEGLVDQFGEKGIVLKPLKGDGPVRTIQIGEIRSIERHESGSGEHLGIFVMGFLVIVGISFAIWANNSEGLM